MVFSFVMSKSINVGVIGFGNMGSAISFALKNKKQYRLYIYDKNYKKIKGLKSFIVCKSCKELIDNADIVILAIKPQDMRDLLNDYAGYLINSPPLIITIAAGLPLKLFEKNLKKARVIRVMPNIAAKVKKAVSFIACGRLVNKSDEKNAKDIFSCLGEVYMAKENFLDKATAISGSGPGFIYYFMDCIYKSAINLGFQKKEAKKMIALIFLGAAKLALSSRKDFSSLVKDVSSKKGTTEAGISVFRSMRLKEAIEEGIKAAFKRAKEITGSDLEC